MAGIATNSQGVAPLADQQPVPSLPPREIQENQENQEKTMQNVARKSFLQRYPLGNTQELFKGLFQAPSTQATPDHQVVREGSQKRRRAPLANSPLQDKVREEYRLTCLIEQAIQEAVRPL